MTIVIFAVSLIINNDKGEIHYLNFITLPMSVIFIPTDFQTEFIQLIKTLSKAIDKEQDEIILGHLFKVKDYEQLYWKKNIEFKKIDPSFLEACESSFGLKKNLYIRNFAGASIAGLKLFFEINHVDFVINPIDYAYKRISKYSIGNPGKIIKRSGYPVNDIHKLYELEDTLI